MSTKRIKARRMWATYNTCDRLPSIAYLKHSELPVKPVAVLDLSDPAALVEQVAKASADVTDHQWQKWDGEDRAIHRRLARDVLKSLGLLSGKAGKGKT